MGHSVSMIWHRKIEIVDNLPVCHSIPVQLNSYISSQLVLRKKVFQDISKTAYSVFAVACQIKLNIL